MSFLTSWFPWFLLLFLILYLLFMLRSTLIGVYEVDCVVGDYLSALCIDGRIAGVIIMLHISDRLDPHQ